MKQLSQLECIDLDRQEALKNKPEPEVIRDTRETVSLRVFQGSLGFDPINQTSDEQR